MICGAPIWAAGAAVTGNYMSMPFERLAEEFPEPVITALMLLMHDKEVDYMRTESGISALQGVYAESPCRD